MHTNKMHTCIHNTLLSIKYAMRKKKMKTTKYDINEK